MPLITVLIEETTTEGTTIKELIQILTGKLTTTENLTKKYTIIEYASYDLFVAGMVTENIDWTLDYDLIFIKKIT